MEMETLLRIGLSIVTAIVVVPIIAYFTVKFSVVAFYKGREFFESTKSKRGD